MSGISREIPPLPAELWIALVAHIEHPWVRLALMAGEPVEDFPRNRLEASADVVGPGIRAEMAARGDSPAGDEGYREEYREGRLGGRWAHVPSERGRLYVYSFQTGKVTVIE